MSPPSDPPSPPSEPPSSPPSDSASATSTDQASAPSADSTASLSAAPAGATDCVFRDRAVYLGDADTLVLADLHVGRAEAAGVDAPLGEATDRIERLKALLAAFEPAQVVFAGDVLDRFDRLSERSRQRVAALRTACLDAGADPVAIAGNHDTRLSDCWPDDVHRERTLGDDTVVCHGHREPDARGRRYLVGHDHPAIAIEGVRRPCFCFGEGCYRGNDLLVLPAFTRLAAGVEINDRRAADFQSPLVASLDALRPIVVDGERGLWFPPLGSFRELL